MLYPSPGRLILHPSLESGIRAKALATRNDLG